MTSTVSNLTAMYSTRHDDKAHSMSASVNNSSANETVPTSK